MQINILRTPVAALYAAGVLTLATLHAAETVPAQPINPIINKPNKAGIVPDPNPQIVGQFGYNMIFAAQLTEKSRKLFYKPVRRIEKRFGIPVNLLPAEMSNSKYPTKTGPAVKGALDEYVYSEDATSDGKGVAYFHEKGKGIYRAAEINRKSSLGFLKKTDTDSTGTDPEKMASGLSILDWEGKFLRPSSKAYSFPFLLFAAPDKKHGKELWLSNGTGGGTKFFADLNPTFTETVGPKNKIIKTPNGSHISPISTYFGDLASPESFGGSAYFSAAAGVEEGETVYNVYRVDSVQNPAKKAPRVPLPVKLFTEFNLFTQPTQLTASPLGMFFAFTTTNSFPTEELWGYDPEDGLLYPLSSGATLVPQNSDFRSGFRARYYQGTFFSGVDGVNGREPFHAGIEGGSPGTPGTPFVASLGNINPAGSSDPRNFTQAANTVFFVANNGTGEHLYRSNGNPGSFQDLGAFTGLRDITPVVEMLPDGNTNGNYVYFVANDGTGTPILWRTNTLEAEQDDNTLDGTPTKVTTVGGNFVKNPTNLKKLVGNGLWYLFFVCDGTGTEYSTVQPKKGPPIPAQRQVWYTGRYVPPAL